MNKRKIWQQAEELVKEYFISNWYIPLAQNFTLRGGELDLVFQKDNIILFVEVKQVDHIEDFAGYITKKKLKSLQKSIQYFLLKNWLEDKFVDLKFVFVKNWKIVSIYDLS